MKKYLLITLLIFSSIGFCQSIHDNLTIKEILQLPDQEINIGLSSLILAKEFYPDLNLDFFLYTFDYLADRYNHFFGKYENPNDKIAALNTFLFKPGYWNDNIIFSYDDTDLKVREKDNRFINGFISSKKGSCITMPLLYIILGERLDWPLFPVRASKHFYVKYVLDNPDPNFQENIETTAGGGYFSDETYKKDLNIPDRAIKQGKDLRELSKREYLASLLVINANQYWEKGNREKAKATFELAIENDPALSIAYYNYAMIILSDIKKYKENNENEEIIKSQLKLYSKYINKAEELGIVHEYPLEFYQKQKQSILNKKSGGI